MGVVWRSLDRQTGDAVALKLLRPGSESERFLRESRLLAELDHPGIVRYVAHGSSDEGPYLVMEWLEGESLAQRLERAELSATEAVRVVTGIASAIGAAHRRMIVHRDLKPSNVFLVNRSIEDVRVLDFGVARQGALAGDLTRTGVIVGSPRYMAPEQARGGAIDRRVDIFAMGIVAWELFTGERLFQADNDAQILLEVAEGKYRTPSSVDPTIPAELERIVMRALSPKPDDRWPTAAAFADALDGWARQHAELVSSAEIARLVHEFCGATIVERRKALAAVLGGTRQPAGFKSMRQTQSSGTGSTAGTSAPLTLDSVKVVPAVTREEIAEHQRRKRMTLVFLAAALGSVAVGLLIVFATLVTGRGRPATATPPSAAPSHTAAPPPATVVVPSARVRVVVTSDTEISEIRGPGVTGVQFKEKGAELELPRSSESVTLLVRLSDGSELSETITPNDNTAIRVRSVAGAVKPSDLPVAPGGKKPVGGKPAGGGGKPAGGGLEANPYE